MPHIHIVTEPESLRWILLPVSEALAQALPNASVSSRPNTEADVNFFNNYALYRPTSTITMALFTHMPERASEVEKFTRAKEGVDWCFSMCSITNQYLPKENTSILPTYPINPSLYKDLVVGVVGRKTRTGRKRLSWVEDLEAIPHVTVRRAKGDIPDGAMPYYYDDIDYLVVTSRLEGGPMPMIEALARKKPVIAPDVGYCWDYPVIRYTTKKELLQIVRDLVIPRNGWEIAAQIILKTYEYLIGATDEIGFAEGVGDPRVDASPRNRGF